MNRGRFVNRACRDDIGWTSGLHRRAAPKGAAHQVAEIMRCRCRWNVHEQCRREKYDHNRVSEEIAEVSRSWPKLGEVWRSLAEFGGVNVTKLIKTDSQCSIRTSEGSIAYFKDITLIEDIFPPLD